MPSPPAWTFVAWSTPAASVRRAPRDGPAPYPRECCSVSPSPPWRRSTARRWPGGCIVACACDRRLMADDARIGASELAVGVPFPVAALEILRHACGSRTEDLVLQRPGSSTRQEAVTVGMVHEVCPGDAVLEQAQAVAAELGAVAPARLSPGQGAIATTRAAADAQRLPPQWTRRSWPSGPRPTPRPPARPTRPVGAGR